MSSRRTISNTFTVTTMDDPVSVQAQYSPDKTVVHTVWQAGDLYMRTRESDESAWSSWHKIVGESGGETDYQFALSANLVTQDGTSATAPSDISSSAWQDAPMATTTQKPYLWSKVQKKDGNGNNVGSATYIRLTGEEGANAPYIELSRTTIIYQANNEGKSTASQNFPITYALKVNGNTCTISSVNNITISLPTNVTVVSGTKTTSGCTINCTHSVVMSGVITITITGTYNGISYTATGSITVSDSRQGEQGEQGEQGDTGERGKVGRFFYYAGAWNDFASTDSFLVNDAQAPYFAYNSKYWVFNPETNGTYTKQNMGTPSSESSNWKLMTNDFKYLITEAIFGEFAKFGASIMNGDYLMSQYVVAVGFQKSRQFINNGTKYQYIEQDDIFAEDDMYDHSAHPSYFPIFWAPAYSSSYIDVSLSSYSDSAKSDAFYLDWSGCMYTVQIEYFCKGSSLSYKISDSYNSSSALYAGTLQEAYIDDETFFTQTFFVSLNNPSSIQRRLFFKLSSNDGEYAEIRAIIIRRVKFTPVMAIDMLSGKIVTNNIIARGELHADSFYYSAIHSNGNNDVLVVTDESIVTLGKRSVGTTVLLPTPSATTEGHIINIFCGQNVKDQDGNPASWFLSYRGMGSSDGFYTPYEAGDDDGYGRRGTTTYWSAGVTWSTSYRLGFGSITHIKLMCQKYGSSYIWVILKAEQTLVGNITLKGGSSAQPISILCNPFVDDVS